MKLFQSREMRRLMSGEVGSTPRPAAEGKTTLLVARWKSGGGQRDELNKPSDSPRSLTYLCHMRLTC